MGYLIGGSGVISNSVFTSGSFWFVNPLTGTLTIFNSPVFGISYLTGFGNIDISCSDRFSGSTSSCLYNSGTMSSTVISNWHHVAFACDTNHTGLGGDPRRFRCVVDGVTKAIDISTPFGTNAAFVMEWSSVGGKVGVPVNPNLIALNTARLAVAQMQIWPGQFIDPTDPMNLNQYLTVTNGIATPAPVSKSHVAFGTPAFEFVGGSAKFPTNQGYGGSFSTVGTPHNYTPLPSYNI